MRLVYRSSKGGVYILKTVEDVKANLATAIETSKQAVECGDAHDLLDMVEEMRVCCAEALAYIQYYEIVNERMANNIDPQCATCGKLRKGVFVESETQKYYVSYSCNDSQCKDQNGKRVAWTQMEVKRHA